MAAVSIPVSRVPISRVLEATGGVRLRGQASGFTGAGIDSRNVAPGSLFFAVAGERFDGHDFAAGAVAAGARGVVVARGRGAALDVGDADVIEVDDVVAALGKLGAAQRAALPSLKLVAVTGSNGKTTTKELLAAIFGAALGDDAVLKTEGNLNNHLGVPLTLLRLHEGHRVAVVEMGMSGLGEIDYLTQLGRPDVAVITNLAGVHLEQLGSIENIARAKAEIFGGLGPRGVAVFPAAERLLDGYTKTLAHTRSFGPANSGAAVTYDDVRVGPRGVDFTVRLDGGAPLPAHLALIGRHNASNAAAAAAAASALGVATADIVAGLGRARAAKHRAQLLPVGDRTVLDDCYNAAPPSMRAALDALAEIAPAGARKVAVLGDMLELGAHSAELHAEVGAYAASRVDELVTVGERARAIHDAAAALGAHRWHGDDANAAAEHVRAVSGAGDVILVKASRGMKLERVIDRLSELLEAR